MGTPAFAAPETAARGEVTAASDVACLLDDLRRGHRQRPEVANALRALLAARRQSA